MRGRRKGNCGAPATRWRWATQAAQLRQVRIEQGGRQMGKGRAVVLVVAAVAAMVCWGVPARADIQVTLTRGYEASGFNGGEFDVWVDHTHDALGYVTQVAPRTYNSGANFATFCLQDKQYFMPTKPYQAEVGTSTNHAAPLGLSNNAAWLFHVWNNRLWSNYSQTVGYAYGDPGQRALDARALQKAIWYFQLGDASYSDQEAQRYIDLTNAHGWGPGRESNIGSVRVLRLYRIDGVNYGHDQALDAQDQMFETPEPGSLVLLACGALGALPLLRRRRVL